MRIPYVGAFFSSSKKHLEFIMARDFCQSDSKGDVTLFQRQKPWSEIIGQALCFTVEKLFHFILIQPRRRIGILIFTALSMFIITLFFYPLPALYASLMLIGQTQNFWIFKLATFLLMETTLLGYGMRAFGRYGSPELKEAWGNKTIVPLHIGSVLKA